MKDSEKKFTNISAIIREERAGYAHELIVGLKSQSMSQSVLTDIKKCLSHSTHIR